MDVKDLINYSGLSFYLTGSRNTIRRNFVPEKFKVKVEELENLIGYHYCNDMTQVSDLDDKMPSENDKPDENQNLPIKEEIVKTKATGKNGAFFSQIKKGIFQNSTKFRVGVGKEANYFDFLEDAESYLESLK